MRAAERHAAERDPVAAGDTPSAEVLQACAHRVRSHNGKGTRAHTDEAILAAASALAGSLSSQRRFEVGGAGEVPV